MALEIIILNTFLLNLKKIACGRNHIDTLAHQMTHSKLRKRVWQRRLPVAKDRAMLVLIMANISGHPDITHIKQLGPPNICINNSGGLANRYTIDI